MHDKVFIGVVGPELIPLKSNTSIMMISRDENDSAPTFVSATKGYVARQILFNRFMESDFDSLLLLDHDMVFDEDTLSALRKHQKPYVTGFYLRRTIDPIYSVWYHPFTGEWPFINYVEEAPRGELVPLGASGWGCILIAREVIEATREVLRGEPDIIEDDMDVWPYDLGAVLRGEESLKPNRVVKDSIVGSDIRYPFYAAAAGYKLWGDADVRPGHVINYILHPDDYSEQTLQRGREMQEGVALAVQKERERILEARRKLYEG